MAQQQSIINLCVYKASLSKKVLIIKSGARFQERYLTEIIISLRTGSHALGQKYLVDEQSHKR